MIRSRSLCAAFALFGAALALLPADARAASVVEVRVGEHPDFTRVVFELDQRAGYRVERRQGAKGDELIVTLEASSGPRKITGRSKVVPVVQVEAAERAVARIQLRKKGLRLQEMILSNPPRIVLDLMRDEPVIAATPKPKPKPAPETAAAPKPAPKPAETKPAETKVAEAKPPAPKPEAKPTAPPKSAVAETKPVPAPKPAPETAKPAETKPAETKLAEAKPPAPKPEPAPEVKPPAPLTPQAVAPKPEPPKPALAETKPAPAPAPLAEARPLPAPEAEPPDPVTAATPEMAKALAPPGEAPKLEPPETPSAPAQTAKPAAPEKPKTETAAGKPAGKPPKASKPSDGLLSNPLVLAAAAGVLVLGAGAFFWMRRRRALPNDLDVTAIADERTDAGDGASQSDEGFSLFEDDAFSSKPSAQPAQSAAPKGTPLDSLFDDDETLGTPARPGAATMTQTTSDLPTDRSRPGAAPARGASAGGAGGDVMRLVQALEARMAQLEAKLEAANEAREKLERQVAAQSEELRVQRAAIARTQRALRTMTRGDEEKATEPALKDTNETTQSKTRINV